MTAASQPERPIDAAIEPIHERLPARDDPAHQPLRCPLLEERDGRDDEEHVEGAGEEEGAHGQDRVGHHADGGERQPHADEAGDDERALRQSLAEGADRTPPSTLPTAMAVRRSAYICSKPMLAAIHDVLARRAG